tara:strand:+ start:151 stop:657 length:507 start_codon:yes stop_codon:yes gene_type:complete
MREINRFYLEIKNIEELKKVNLENNELKVKLLKKIDFNLNKFFYKQIGKNHRWTDRLSWNDNMWVNYVSDKSVNTFVLMYNKNLAGYFERIYNKQSNEFEIAYFGILHEYRNKKFGAYLLSKAIELSFKDGAKRVWVHTCTFDHKNAIKNYLSRGMKIFKEEKIKIPA